MKLNRCRHSVGLAVFGGFIAFLGACSSSTQESLSSENVITPSTSTVVAIEEPTTTTSSTVPLIKTSELPQLTKCPVKEISADTSEVFQEIIRCVDGWAVGIPQRYVAKFNGDTDVEAEWVLANTKTGWTVVGVCHIYYPIYSSGATCSWPYDAGKVSTSLIPPMPVQCVLWDGAKFESAIPATGCPSSPQ